MMRSFVSFFVVLLLLTACSSKEIVDEGASATEQPAPVQETNDKKDIWGWDYSANGPRGPLHWADLNDQYDMCASGKQQSPINLVWHKPQKANPLNIQYKESSATIINAGYTFRIELTPQSRIVFNDKEYLLEKIEFRSPSEHTLSGNQLPMELQFYHRSSNGLKRAILSLFVITGRGSAWFDRLLENTAGVPNYRSSAAFKFNPAQLIPPRQTFYHYEGSLTHPPCLENVQWIVFNTPLQLSTEQIAKFRSLFEPNNRPIQPSGERPITNY